MPDPSDGMSYPNRPEEMQDMEMEPVVVGPGSYASPDPTTEAARLLPLSDHPLADEIAEDYGAMGVTPEGEVVQKEAVAAEGAEGESEIDSMTVAELDEAYGDHEDYPESGNKAAKVAFAKSVEEE